MTKSAVAETYESYLTQLASELGEVVADEFGGGLLGKVAGRGAKPMLERIESEMHTQGELLVDYAAAEEPDEREHLRQEFLQTNPVYRRYEGDRTEELEDVLLTHFESAAEDLEPLVQSDSDDFWEAMQDAYTETEAKELFNRHFDQAATFKEYREGVFSSQTVGGKVIGIVEESENRLRETVFEDLEQAYE